MSQDRLYTTRYNVRSPLYNYKRFGVHFCTDSRETLLTSRSDLNF